MYKQFIVHECFGLCCASRLPQRNCADAIADERFEPKFAHETETCRVEETLDNHAIKIQKLETMLDNKARDQKGFAADECKHVSHKFANLQLQVDALKNGPPIHKSDVDKTIVVGGLDELRMLQKATQWLSQKLKEWEGPKHVGTYIKSVNFQGVMFAKFSTIYDRDITAALLCSANVREGGKRIWATQDLPIPVRARKSLLLGLRWQLGDWGLMKKESSIDDMYGTMTISGRNVVKVRCEKG